MSLTSLTDKNYSGSMQYDSSTPYDSGYTYDGYYITPETDLSYLTRNQVTDQNYQTRNNLTDISDTATGGVAIIGLLTEAGEGLLTEAGELIILDL